LERASEGLALLQAPYPTVGDEFQAVAYTLEDALLLTLRAQLLLPPQLQLRFGIGRPPHDDVALWVLSDFSKDELPAMNAAFQGAAGLFDALLNEDPKKLLPEWKKRQGGVQ